MVVLAGMNILAAALTFHQQQEKAKALKDSPPNNNNNNNNAANLNHHLLLANNKTTTPLPLVLPLVVAKKLTVSPGLCSRFVGSSVSCPLPMAVSPGKKRKVVEIQGEESSSSSAASVVSEDKVEVEVGGCCLWKGCRDNNRAHHLLEHIQTVHVSGQTKGEGFVCLWEGCKVFNHKSSSRSWLERHILSHSGTKPFKCIIPGCGQSFGVQGALERHVNSHMSTPGGALNLANRKMESSPFKGSRRKKQRCRKQRLNIGQYVDYFDKRVMEVIKQRLATSVDVHFIHAHHATFRGKVVAKCTAHGQEPQVLIQWSPGSILPDEWVRVRAAEYHFEKRVPLTQLPKEKLPLIFSTLFGSGVVPSGSGGGKNRRKWSSNSNSTPNASLEATTTTKITSTCSSISSASSTSSGICSPLHTPSPTSITSITDNESDEGIASCSSATSPSKFSLSSSPLEEPLGPPLEEGPLGEPLLEDQEEFLEDCEESLSSDDESEWAVDALLDSFILS